MGRLAQVSQACNRRYLDALATLDSDTPIHHLVHPVCNPVHSNGQRVRALRPWSPEDQRLLQSINRGEFALNGLRNRDLLPHLYPEASACSGTNSLFRAGDPQAEDASGPWDHPQGDGDTSLCIHHQWTRHRHGDSTVPAVDISAVAERLRLRIFAEKQDSRTSYYRVQLRRRGLLPRPTEGMHSPHQTAAKASTPTICYPALAF